MIVWIASYPRSGNGFFRDALRTLYGVRSLDVHNMAKVREDRRVDPTHVAVSDDLHFLKTHSLPTDDAPAFYLVRDGRDALVSFAWFELEQRGLKGPQVKPPMFHRELLRVLRGRRNRWIPFLRHPFGTWSDNVRSWRARPNTVVVRFEELVGAPEETIAKAVSSMGLDLSLIPTARVRTFEELQTQNSKVYRRGQTESWRDEFPQDLLPLFWKLHGSTMRDLGYAD